MGITYYSVYKNSTGNVGIGTISPSNNLVVYNASSWAGGDLNGSSGGELRFLQSGSLKANMYASTSTGFVINGGSETIFQIGASEKMRLTGANLGIGTTGPASILHLNSTAPTILTLSSTSYPSTYYTTFGVDSAARAFLIFGNNGENQVRAGRTATGGYLDFYTNNTVAQTTLASDGNFVMRLSASGNVGIGTDTPILKLVVKGASSYPATTGTAQTGVFRLTGGTGLYNVLDMGINESTDTAWIQATRANSLSTYDKLLINPYGGNVGIGTTSPAVNLHVVSSGNTTIKTKGGSSNNQGSSYYVEKAGSTSTLTAYGDSSSITGGTPDQTVSIWTAGSIPLLFQVGGGERVRILSDGNVGIGTSSPSAKIELYNGNFKISDGNRIIFGASDPQIYGNSGVLTFRTNSSDRMYLDANGNLGIGTSSPANKLHVNGSTTAGGNILFTSEYYSLSFPTSLTYAGGITGDDGNYKRLSLYHGYAINFIIGNSATFANSKMLLDSNGNLGIGTTSPTGTYGKLSVAGGIRILDDNNAKLEIGRYSSGASNSYIKLGSNSNSLRITNNTDVSDIFTIENGGNVGVGTTSPIQKLHVLGNTVFGNFGRNTYKYNLYLSFEAAADESWIRIYLPQDYSSTNNGGTVKVRVLWAGDHATFGAHEEYQISYKTYYPSPYLAFSNIICTNKTTDFGGATYYPASSTPNSIFYSNSSNYLYIKIKGYYGAVNTTRFIEAEVFGRVAGVPTIETTTAPASPTELTKTIQFLPQEGNIYLTGSIGIGTTSPASPLTAQSNAKQLRLQTTSSPTSYFTDIGSRYDSSHPFTIEVANGAATATEYFGIYADAGGANNRIALLNGNVGIGTTTTTNGKVVIYNTSGNTLSLQKSGGGPALIMGSDTTNYALIEAIASGGVRFYTGDGTLTEKMRIAADGNVGIGTTNPTSKLHIVGNSTFNGQISSTGAMSIGMTPAPFWNARFTDYSDGSGVYIGSVQAGGYKYISGESYYNNSSFWHSNTTTSAAIGLGDGILRFYTDSGLTANTNFIPSERMRITVGGNVGIGTTSPGQKLEVATTTSNTRVRINSTEVVATEYFRSGTGVWLVGSDSSNSFKIARASNFGTNDYLSINSATADVTFFDTALGARMTLNGTGLGIGTTSPANKLDVVSATANNGSPFAGCFFSGDDSSASWRCAVNLQHNANTTIAIGSSVGLSFAPLSSTSSNFYGSAAIKGVRPNTTANNQDTDLAFWTRTGASNTTVDTEKLRITGTGNVGIGTTSPGYKLDVSGTGRFTGDLTLSGALNGAALNGTTGFFSSDLSIVGQHQIRNANPTITFRDTNNRTAYIHVNGDIFYVLTAVADSAYGSWGQVANSRWPLELNLSTNNAVFGADVNAISFTGAGTGLTGTAASLSIGGAAGSINGFNNPTTAATVNTIVYRDSGGDIYGRYLFGSYVNSSDDTSSTGLTYIMAKFGDNYHRSASAAKVATFISGQTMDINGSSTSCSGTATTATTANALNTSNSYTVTQLDIAATTPSLYVRNTGTGPSAIRLLAFNNSTYIQSGTSTASTSADLVFSSMGAISEWIRILGSNGNVGIGTASPAYKLDVNGNIHATAFPTSSDIRFKKNITPLENSLEKVKKLQGVRYEWNEFINSVRDGYKLNVPIIGLIAQDVEKIVPEIIELWRLSDDCQDARSIDYPRLIPVLIEAIKEQQIIIENQNQKIENLIARMSALEAR